MGLARAEAARNGSFATTNEERLSTLTQQQRDTLDETMDALKASRGNRTKAAAELGISAMTMHKRIRRAIEAGVAVPAPSKRGAPRKKSPKRTGEIRYQSKEEKAAAWAAYVAAGRVDDDLRNELIEAEMPKLKGLAYKMRRSFADQIEEGELLSEGAMALIDAAKRYEPQRCSFWTFSARRALGAMLDYARQIDPISRVCRTRSKTRIAFEQEFATKNGRPPTDDETTVALNWSEIQLASSYATSIVSIETTVCDEGFGQPITLRDVLATCEDGPDSNEVTEDFFRDVTRGLGWDQQTMLFLYCVRGASMKNIGLALGLSESRVSQQITQAKSVLMERIRRERQS